MSKWTEEEFALLEDCYSKYMNPSEMVDLFPNRDLSSIKNKAVNSGLTKKYKKRKESEPIQIGDKFGLLTVIDWAEPMGSEKRKAVKCKCDCGNIHYITEHGLRNGTQSCGCLWSEKISEANTKRNRYDLNGDFGIGWTNNTNKEFYFDKEDFDLIKDYSWSESSKSRTYRALVAGVYNSEKQRTFPIKFTELIGCKNYDHINRNPLDNRKNNLRLATVTQNNINKSLQKRNKSGVTGVCFDNTKGKWLATIGIDYKNKFLGYYEDKKEAIKARLGAELLYFKEFAPQQHLFKEYDIRG